MEVEYPPQNGLSVLLDDDIAIECVSGECPTTTTMNLPGSSGSNKLNWEWRSAATAAKAGDGGVFRL